MERMIGSLFLIVVLSSFVFAGTISTTTAEFDVVDSFEDDGRSPSDSFLIEKSSEGNKGILRNLGVLVLIIVVLVIVKKLFTSFGGSGKPIKKKTFRKRKIVGKSKEKKK